MRRVAAQTLHTPELMKPNSWRARSARVSECLDRFADVPDPVGARFAFDGKRAVVLDGFQRLEESLGTDLPVAEGSFFAPRGARLGRGRGVLDVDVADERRERVHRADRI